MSENIYGVWKRRFPIIKALRTHFQLSLKLIVATAILFNMGRIWGDGEPDDEDGEGGDHADHEAV